MLFTLILLVSACKSTDKITYLQNVESLSGEQLSQNNQPFNTLIKPNDLLKIVVSGSEDAETYFPFNILVPTPNSENSVQSQMQLQNYLVDGNGQINFPELGKITVINQKTDDVASVITQKLRTYLKGNIIVTVRFASYRISVLGEVNKPGMYTVKDEKVNILQAVSLASDLTIYGRRDVVKVLRELPNGQKTIATLNLNDKNLIFSPYFYLQQGDVVYVEPNKAKSKGADIGTATITTFSVVSVLVSMASLIVTILR